MGAGKNAWAGPWAQGCARTGSSRVRVRRVHKASPAHDERNDGRAGAVGGARGGRSNRDGRLARAHGMRSPAVGRRGAAGMGWGRAERLLCVSLSCPFRWRGGSVFFSSAERSRRLRKAADTVLARGMFNAWVLMCMGPHGGIQLRKCGGCGEEGRLGARELGAGILRKTNAALSPYRILPRFCGRRLGERHRASAPATSAGRERSERTCASCESPGES